MNDNVRPLRPESAESTKLGRGSKEHIEEMATRLELMAAQLRSGEETAQFGMIVWYNHKNQCMRWQIGQQSTHENVLLLTLAQRYALDDENLSPRV